MTEKEQLKQLIQREYITCVNDCSHFIKNYCKISHPLRGKIPFELYDFQESTLKKFTSREYCVILKARQLGISSLTAGYALWLMTFFPNSEILIIAISQEIAKNLLTKVALMYDNLPSWLKVNCTEYNKLNLKLINGSNIKAISSKKSASRSEALTLLILDEAAFIANANDIWTASQPSLSTGGQCILLSTPNGVGNFFHRMWEDGEAGITFKIGNSVRKFIPIKLPWYLHPDHDQEWRNSQDIILKSKKKAAQEHDCDFISSGDNVIDGLILKWYKDTQVKDPIEKRWYKKLWIWKYPEVGKRYIICADVGRGDGGDYSAFHIIDLEELEQIAEYKGHISTQEYGNKLVNISIEYNEAILVIENASIGWATIQVAIDRGYKNLYYSETGTHKGYLNIDELLSSGKDIQDKSKVIPGFTTSSRTRPLIIERASLLIESKELKINSSRLISELFVFIWKNGKAQAMQGYNDDLVMSLSIGLWTRDNALRLFEEGLKMTKEMIENIQRSMPLDNNLYVKGTDFQNPWEIKIGNSNEIWNLAEIIKKDNNG